MQSSANSTINNLINKATSSEISVFRFIVKIQEGSFNKKGYIHHVNYKEISKSVNISIQGFYDAMEGLESKGIIQVINKRRGDWKVAILGDPKKGYVNFSHYKFFDDRYFNNDIFDNYSVVAKRIMLYFAMLCNTDNNTVFLKNLASKIHCRASDAYAALYSLMGRINFSIIKTKNGTIIVLKGMENRTRFIKEYNEQDKNKIFTHNIKAWCRKFSITYSQEDIVDLYQTYNDLKMGKKNQPPIGVYTIIKGIHKALKQLKRKILAVGYIRSIILGEI